MAHKYLNELGISSDRYSMFNSSKPGLWGRIQKLKHGFPESEVTDLADTSAMWLYEHIKVYKDIASRWIVMDDSTVTFKIPVLYTIKEDEMEYWRDDKCFPIQIQVEKEEEHTQLEAINLIIEYLEYFLTEPDFPKDDELVEDDSDDVLPVISDETMYRVSVSENKKWECIKCAFKIYAIIIGSMWI